MTTTLSASCVVLPVGHFTFAEAAWSGRRFVNGTRNLMRSVYRSVRGVGQRLGLCKPTMQMNKHPLDAVFDILRSVGIRELHVAYTDHGGRHGAMLFGRQEFSGNLTQP